MKKGFTLAEVLITLGIIGVVAALTIPTLMRGYQKRLYVTQLQKVYNLLTTQIQTYMREEGLTTLYPGFNAQRFFSRYVTTTKYCGTDPTGCMASQYTSLDGNNTYTISDMLGARYTCGVLDTGATLCFEPPGTSDEYENGEITWHTFYQVVIDINGPKPPNTKGRDYFNIELYSDGKVADSYDKTTVFYKQAMDAGRANNCLNGVEGYADHCFGKIISDGWSMDY